MMARDSRRRVAPKRAGSSTASDIEGLVADTLGRLSDAVLSRGVHLEISGASSKTFRVRSGGKIDDGESIGSAVRIRGSAERIGALLGGRKHPTAVFVEGGIEVAGDVHQITLLSEELPALTMKRK